MKPPAYRSFGSGEFFLNAKPGDTIQAGKLSVTVVTPAEAEAADYVVCIERTTPLVFPDNASGPCQGCGTSLQWRPTSPVNPPKLCMDCALVRALRKQMDAAR